MGESLLVPIMVGSITPIIVAYLTQKQTRQKTNQAALKAGRAESTAVSCREELAVLKVEFGALKRENENLRLELKEMTTKWQEGRDVLNAVIEKRLWDS